jgi:hypothetical protein
MKRPKLWMTHLALQRDLDLNKGDKNFKSNEKIRPDIDFSICQSYVLLVSLLLSDVFILRS